MTTKTVSAEEEGASCAVRRISFPPGLRFVDDADVGSGGVPGAALAAVGGGLVAELHLLLDVGRAYEYARQTRASDLG